jgi:hypothetical protein
LDVICVTELYENIRKHINYNKKCLRWELHNLRKTTAMNYHIC